MNRALRVLLGIFAAYRLASLISSEEGPYLGLWKPKEMGVFEKIRMELGAYDYGPDGKPQTSLGRGISCPLCTGVYLSGIVAAVTLLPSSVGDIFLTWFGISGAQVFLENLTSDEAIEGAIEDVAERMDDE